eukprot:CAMPEP_0119265166 /NCGR_PEP_ID=MMETSP1329-20130426/4052_1 /TAXON_ID=114041 /ORGANISM="Genus nov. species nov., Strain RCC1024" /LENGTH=233 /DNA_ID=CAMNT_0007264977 /DNA_START=49 /DNA_END=747 /DNA_ORIENTATION=-
MARLVAFACIAGSAAYAPARSVAPRRVVAVASRAEIGSFMDATLGTGGETRPKEEITDYLDGKEGLKYKDLVVGTGDSPVGGDELEVHYAGWYYAPGSAEGVKFDDSKERDANKGLVFELGVAPIIKGWALGLETMRQGGSRSLIIPPALGYGDKEVSAAGRPPIPANSELRFELELLKVDNNPIRKFRRAVGDFLRPPGDQYISAEEQKGLDAGTLKKPLLEQKGLDAGTLK